MMFSPCHSSTLPCRSWVRLLEHWGTLALKKEQALCKRSRNTCQIRISTKWSLLVGSIHNSDCRSALSKPELIDGRISQLWPKITRLPVGSFRAFGRKHSPTPHMKRSPRGCRFSVSTSARKEMQLPLLKMGTFCPLSGAMIQRE